jgi:hypothetical protein
MSPWSLTITFTLRTSIVHPAKVSCAQSGLHPRLSMEIALPMEAPLWNMRASTAYGSKPRSHKFKAFDRSFSVRVASLSYTESMSSSPQTLTQIFLREWDSLSQHIVNSKRHFKVDGKSLDLACILAVSRLVYSHPRRMILLIEFKGTVLMWG